MLNGAIACVKLETIIGDDLWWTYALLLSHMLTQWLMVTDFVSILATKNTLYSIIGDDYDVFVASWGDDLGDDWYHMNICVVSRRIAWFDMGHNYLCAWWLMWLMICILVTMWTYVCRWINVDVELSFYLIIWSLNWWIPFHLIMLTYEDVN